MLPSSFLFFLFFLSLRFTQTHSCVAYADPSDEDLLPERDGVDPLEIKLNLGNLEFPTSGSEEAKPYFKNGLLLLHNFWYDLSADYFQEAQRIDPSYAMAYWGEAMAQNQQLWLTENVPLSASIMAKIPADAPMTEREREYIDAANTLFGTMPAADRYLEYSSKMQVLARNYPEDMDASAFYALSRLSCYTWGFISRTDWFENEFENVMNILNNVYATNPENPAGPHYIIHACDDPENAEFALEAAYAYPRIAQDVAHAHHMPCHIYLRLGMWNDSHVQDLTAFNVSVWFADQIGNTPDCGYDWHSLRYSVYSSLQKGQWTEARNNIQLVKDLDNDYYYFQYINALESSGYILETQEFQDANDTIPPLIVCPECTDTRDSHSYFHWTHLGNSAILTAQGLAAVANSEYQAAIDIAKIGQEYEAQLLETEPYYAALYGVAWRQVAAAHDIETGDSELGFHYLDETLEIQKTVIGQPNDGPPVPIQPVYEFYAVALYKTHQYELSLQYFDESLSVLPGRAHTLFGKARVQEDMGDTDGAYATYQQLLYQYFEADPDIPPYLEAQNYVDSNECPDCGTTTGDSGGSEDLDMGVIVLIVVVIVVAGLFVALGVYLMKKKRSRPREKLMMDSDINYLYA